MSNLKILSINIMKSSEIYHSLLNNQKLKNFSFLLFFKPQDNVKVGSPHFVLHYHMHWQFFFPSTFNIENTYNINAFYSIIWVNKIL